MFVVNLIQPLQTDRHIGLPLLQASVTLWHKNDQYKKRYVVQIYRIPRTISSGIYIPGYILSYHAHISPGHLGRQHRGILIRACGGTLLKYLSYYRISWLFFWNEMQFPPAHRFTAPDFYVHGNVRGVHANIRISLSYNNLRNNFPLL